MPPVVLLLSAVVAPTHRLLLPVMVPTNAAGFTVTAFVAVAVPQLDDTM